MIEKVKIIGTDGEGRNWELVGRIEASKIYGCTPSRISALARQGKLETVYLSGGNQRQPFFIKDEVESMSQQNEWLRSLVLAGRKAKEQTT